MKDPEPGIEVEVWDLPADGLGRLLPTIATPLALGQVDLNDGSVVTGFVADASALDAADDITEFGSWRAYLAVN